MPKTLTDENPPKKIENPYSPVLRERIQLLVDALRSGSYVQGHSKLKYIDDVNKDDPLTLWCCLGVACDIHRQKIRQLSWNKPSADRYGDIPNYENYAGENNFPPLFVFGWFGLPKDRVFEQDGMIRDIIVVRNNADLEWNLDRTARMNDSGHDFETIAKALEDTYLKPEVYDIQQFNNGNGQA